MNSITRTGLHRVRELTTRQRYPHGGKNQETNRGLAKGPNKVPENRKGTDGGRV